MKNIKLFIGLILITVSMGCSPHVSFIKVDYDGHRGPTQAGYGSSGYGHREYGLKVNEYRGFDESKYGFKGYNYKNKKR